jgi:hypothetical protein
MIDKFATLALNCFLFNHFVQLTRIMKMTFLLLVIRVELHIYFDKKIVVKIMVRNQKIRIYVR